MESCVADAVVVAQHRCLTVGDERDWNCVVQFGQDSDGVGFLCLGHVGNSISSDTDFNNPLKPPICKGFPKSLQCATPIRLTCPIPPHTGADQQKGKPMQVIPKPEHGSLPWLNVRHRDDNDHVTFGGSEAGALMGVSEYTTLADLCISKLYPPEVKEPEPQMIKGLIFEEPLLQEAARRIGLEVTTPNFMYRKGRFTVTLDGLAYEANDYDNPVRIIEAKVTAAYTVNTAEDLPQSWVMQGHVQQWVLGLPVSFVVFDKRQHINLIDMPYDEALMDDILNIADVVGYDLDSGVMPSYAYKGLSSDQVAKLYPVQESRAITAGDDLVNYIFDLETTRNQLKKLKDEETALMDAIAREMGDADEVTDANGFTMLTWRQQKGRQSFDSKAFQAAHPDLYAQFTKEGAPFRVMRFGKGNR